VASDIRSPSPILKTYVCPSMCLTLTWPSPTWVSNSMNTANGAGPYESASSTGSNNLCKGPNSLSPVLIGRVNAAFATDANVPMPSRSIGMRAGEVLAERVNPEK
jgi:hypothetical protein